MRLMLRIAAGLGVALFAATAAVAEPPRVVSMTPEFGESAVDPALAEIRIEFDQDMHPGGRSICGGGPAFPAISGQPRWESARVLVVPVKLEPSHRYEMSVNCPAALGFRSAAGGEPAVITPLVFTTAADSSSAQMESLTPERNRAAVEALRTALLERYSHRDVRLVDWEAEIGAVEAHLVGARAPGAFARIAAGVLGEARDVHLSVMVGSARIGTFAPMQTPNCDLKTLARIVPGWTQRSGVVFTGVFEDGVAYVMIASWPGDREMVAPAVEFIEEHRGAPGMIVDVRANGGGDELAARAVAALFVDRKAVYSRNRYRDPAAADGWGPMLDRVIEPAEEGKRYGGPVAVLIGPSCMSSNESFVLMMATSPRVTLVGEHTYGSSGNPKPVDLGNGVTVLLPSWQDFRPDGVALEGVGVPPGVGVRVRADELAASDPVLEAGLRAVRRRP